MSDSEYDLDMLTSMLDCDEPEDGSSAAVIGPPVQATVVCDDPFGDELDLNILAGMMADDANEQPMKVPDTNTLTAPVTTITNAAALGLDMSDDEDSNSAPCSTSKPKETVFSAAFGAAFSDLKRKAQKDKALNSFGSPMPKEKTPPRVEVIDPLEKELREMEERMNKIKSELAKKKKLDMIKPDGTARRFTKLTNHTEVREKTKLLNTEEKQKLLQRLRDNKNSVVHGGETDSEDDEDNMNPFESNYNSYGKAIKKNLANTNTNNFYSSRNKFADESVNKSTSAASSCSGSVESLALKRQAVLSKIQQSPQSWQGVKGSLVGLKEGAAPMSLEERNAVRDTYSGIYVVNPTVTPAVLAERMDGRRHINVATIPLHMRGGEIEGDWVTIAVLVAKSQPKTSQKGTTYSIWQLSDLGDCSKTVGLFLFGSSHTGLWKTAVGTVVGVLNAQVMKDREGSTGGTNFVTLSIHDAMRVMVMGTARDLGWCRGRTKAGATCRQFVNKSVCEFCIYHVQREYQKTSSKRADLQSSFSAGGPKSNSLKQKVFGKDQVFYGGNLYTGDAPAVPAKQNTKYKAKDLATLSSLKLQLKSKELKEEDRKKSFVLSHLSDGELSAVKDMVRVNDSLGERLLAPTPGARNLLRHKAQETQLQINESKQAKGIAISLSAKDLLKMTQKQMNERRNQQISRASTSQSKGAIASPTLRLPVPALPQLGRGLVPGQSIDFDVSPQQRKSFDPAKAKALAILKRKGETLKLADKNVVRSKEKVVEPEFQEKVRKRLRESLNTESDSENNNGSSSKKAKNDESQRSLLGSVDLNSDKIKAMMEKKSRHSNLVDAEEDLQMEKYYMKLEKKEMLEDKMSSIMEVATSAVVCTVCKYQSVLQSQYCKDQGHIVKSVKASKRFFECVKCKRRTVSLEKMPVKACSNCSGGSWKRVAMVKAKKGPKLDNESLCLRGNEEKYYGSATGEAFLHIDN